MTRVAILGVGGLGAALARGLVKAGGIDLVLCDRNDGKVAQFKQQGVAVVVEASAAVANADVVVLAVKPKSVVALIAAVAPTMKADALLVSVAAGVPLSALAGAFGGLAGRAVARAMPNIGAAAGMSVTGVVFGPGCARPRDADRMRAVFGAIGTVRDVSDENQLHAVTAVAASGPAFLLLAVEALVDAGVEQGLARADALAFARGALVAAASRLDEALEPTLVRAQVTSPAGTTAAGLSALERHGVRGAFVDAVRAACERSRELARPS